MNILTEGTFNLKSLPVMKENFLIMICCFNEAKVIFQCSNKSMQSLGTGGITVEDPDRDGTLLAGSLHFIDRELHLEDKRMSKFHREEEKKKVRLQSFFNWTAELQRMGSKPFALGQDLQNSFATAQSFKSLSHREGFSVVSLRRYLVSNLWVTSSFQVLSMVWHSEFHSTVFICNHSLLSFLKRTWQIKLKSSFQLMKISTAGQTSLKSCSLNKIKISNLKRTNFIQPADLWLVY